MKIEEKFTHTFCQNNDTNRLFVLHSIDRFVSPFIDNIKSLENAAAWNVTTSTGKEVAECDPAHDCPSSLSNQTLYPLNRQGVGKVNFKIW